MPFEEITDPSAVRSAIEEYRTLGQTRFLKKYAFGASRGWMLRDTDGEEYDAKAILGAAHGYQHPPSGTCLTASFTAECRQLANCGSWVLRSRSRPDDAIRFGRETNLSWHLTSTCATGRRFRMTNTRM